MRTQIGDIILSQYLFIYYFFISQGLSTGHPTSLKTHILKSNSMPHRSYAKVLVINDSNMSSLSNPTDESKDFRF
jgi:hypothetical protein